MGCSRALLICCFLLACDGLPGPGEDAPAISEEATPELAQAPLPAGPRPQPKPGERVRQPELDDYCLEAPRPVAYYYHGGAPVRRLARKDRCTPLYITECEASGHCYPPRDQEPGMWCCGTPQPIQTAERQQARR